MPTVYLVFTVSAGLNRTVVRKVEFKFACYRSLGIAKMYIFELKIVWNQPDVFEN